jgi:3-oxoadipate CoA-transferase beta subunit
MSAPLTRHQIAWRAAQDVQDGAYVNLGLGMPILIVNYVPGDREVIYHSENGLLGMGSVAPEGEEDHNLVDAGGQRITLLTGAAVFDSSEAFMMMRGGHLDCSMLGAFEVSETGDIANWDNGHSDRGPLIGGAMDLVAGAREVRVLMDHTTRDGAPRIVKACSLPLTGAGVIRRIYTSLAVLEITDDGVVAHEILDGLSFDELQVFTEPMLSLAPDCKPLRAPEL